MDIRPPNEPIFHLYVQGMHVASLYGPQIEDVFWCSYRIEPTCEKGDQVIHDDKIWQLVDFTVMDSNGHIPNPLTFSGGYDEFCARRTDRLSFRSLWPQQPKSRDSVYAWLRGAINKALRIVNSDRAPI